jgi:TRAP-type C4-dicarboxylate transport system substrate-binding protein
MWFGSNTRYSLPHLQYVEMIRIGDSLVGGRFAALVVNNLERRRIMKKIGALVLVTFILHFPFTFVVPQNSFAGGTTWKVLASWPKGYPEIDKYLLGWTKHIEKATGGRVTPKWMGGPEVVHPFEQLKAVQRGLCDVLFTHPAYHPGVVSAGQASDLFYASPEKRAKTGWTKMMTDLYKTRAGVKYLNAFASGMPYQLFLNKEIESADLRGLKIRATPFYRPVVEGLGGATVQMPTGEIYTGMQRGVIDGFCAPGVYPLGLKLYEVTKYAILPGFGEVNWINLVHMDSWDKLSDDLKSTVEKATVEFQEKMRPVFQENWEIEKKEIVKRGMKLIQLPPADSKKMLDIFATSSWQELVLKKDAEYGPKLKALADKIAE